MTKYIFLLLGLIHLGIFLYLWILKGEFNQVQLVTSVAWIAMFRIELLFEALRKLEVEVA